jgi:hypothetical protein
MTLEAFTWGLCGGRWWAFAAYSVSLVPLTWVLLRAWEE